MTENMPVVVRGPLSPADAETLSIRAFDDYHNGRRDRAHAYIDGIRGRKSFDEILRDVSGVGCDARMRASAVRPRRPSPGPEPVPEPEPAPCPACDARFDRLLAFVESKPYGTCRSNRDRNLVTTAHMREFVLSHHETHTCGRTNREIADFLYPAR